MHIRVYARNLIARQPVINCIGSKVAIIISGDALSFSADPEAAFTIFKQINKATRPQSFRITRIEDLKAQAVIAHKAAEGREPEESVAGLEDRVDGDLRQSIVGCPRVEAELLFVNSGLRGRARAPCERDED